MQPRAGQRPCHSWIVPRLPGQTVWVRPPDSLLLCFEFTPPPSTEVDGADDFFSYRDDDPDGCEKLERNSWPVILPPVEQIMFAVQVAAVLFCNRLLFSAWRDAASVRISDRLGGREDGRRKGGRKRGNANERGMMTTNKLVGKLIAPQWASSRLAARDRDKRRMSPSWSIHLNLRRLSLVVSTNTLWPHICLVLLLLPADFPPQSRLLHRRQVRRTDQFYQRASLTRSIIIFLVLVVLPTHLPARSPLRLGKLVSSRRAG